ncbi:MAG: glycosyltransferase [Bacteroides sp.]|nr:glycosyltransferase [Bacteroides sp.]
MIAPLISVVVPLYNVEMTVQDCLESLRAQTYNNFEVILVNDGSPDRSADVCRRWIDCNGDSRFRVLDKKNGGVSDARNFGISQCSPESEFVIFVDSDDELTPDALSILTNSARHDALVIGSVLRCLKSDNPKVMLRTASSIEMSDIWRNANFLERLRFGIINSSCGNCYSLKVIRDNKLSYKNQFPEDTFFNVDYLAVVTRVVYIDRPLYYYYIWKNSITTNPKEELYTNYMLLQQHLYQIVGDCNKDYINRFVYPQYRVNTMNFLRIGDRETPRQFLKHPLVRTAIQAYIPVSFADYVLNYCLKRRWLKLANFFN